MSLANGIIEKGGDLPCPVDDNGKFVAPVGEPFVGVHVKEADKAIIADLKSRGRLLRNETLNHSYPFCWRRFAVCFRIRSFFVCLNFI